MSSLLDQLTEDGFVIIEEFLTPDEVEELYNAGVDLCKNAPQEERIIFSTVNSSDAQNKNQYFLESGDKVRYFFEEGAIGKNGELLVDSRCALNKVGHALHVEHPIFKKITFSNRVKEICWQLGYSRPAVPQSMYIYKNPGIGGEVTPHQDATYLFTRPNSTIGFWIALEDAAKQNGCLQFITGSHKSRVHRRYIRNPDKESKELILYDRPAPFYSQSSFVPAPVKKGMIQLHKRHKASHLKDEILKYLRSFNIDIGQIYSNTTDNGSNVLKVSKILQELQEEYIAEELQNTETGSNDEETIQSSLESVLSVVRCAAHTIQLAANDVIKPLEAELSECRNAVKKLRTMVRSGDVHVQMPVLDNITRWNSMYEMLNSLLKIREFIEAENAENYNFAHDINWEFVTNFVSSFRPLAECSKKLQHEQYVIGDFYRDWLTCELELEDLIGTTTFARLLFDAMVSRKAKLLENDAFLAALYLDPRFNYQNSAMLTDEQKNKAVNHLIKTFEIVKKLEDVDVEENFASTSSQGASCSYGLSDYPPEAITVTSAADSCIKYSKLEQRMNLIAGGSTSSAEVQRTMRQKISLLANGKKVSLDANILQYWKTNAFDNDVRKLIQVALAVPSTQVSVERAFSALSLIITKLRTKLSNKTINSILLTKLNYALLQNQNVNIDFNNE